MSTWSPFSLKSAIDPSEIETFSSNVSSSCLGGNAMLVFSPGLELSSTAWAEAGAATNTTSTNASVHAPASLTTRGRELPGKRMRRRAYDDVDPTADRRAGPDADRRDRA